MNVISVTFDKGENLSPRHPRGKPNFTTLKKPVLSPRNS
jgi:hypothetical protein